MTFGTTSRPATSSMGDSWLMVGCTYPVLMAWMVAMASMPPAAPRQCPIMLLVALILVFFSWSAENTFLMALISALSPTRVEVACALM